MSADRVRYPCRCCFIECEPYDATSKTSKVYPCRDALRLWARAHRNDEGDEGSERGNVPESCHDDFPFIINLGFGGL